MGADCEWPGSSTERGPLPLKGHCVVKAVVFDVGRVLFQWQLRALMEKLTVDPDELEYVLAHVVTESWHYQHDAGRPIGEMVAERISQFPEYARFIRAYGTRFNETIPGPVAGSLEIVHDLDAAGVPLFAITNFGADFWDAFRPTQPVFDRFVDVVVSGKERMVKPDPAIYRLAVTRFGYLPEAMLFIDDNPNNVAGAAECDWQVHQFVDALALRRDLVGRGLLRT